MPPQEDFEDDESENETENDRIEEVSSEEEWQIFTDTPYCLSLLEYTVIHNDKIRYKLKYMNVLTRQTI